jgi:hypothetical protein
VRRFAAAAALALMCGSVLAVEPVAGPARGAVVAAEGGGAADSSVTVHGAKRGSEDFSNLAVAVSQTKNLTNQAIIVSWTGGRPTPRLRPLGVDFLQIMQCWGDAADAGNADDPRDQKGLAFRETCQFGTGIAPPALPSEQGQPSQDANTRAIRLITGSDTYPVVDPDECAPSESGGPLKCPSPATVGGSPAQIVPFRTVDGEFSRDGSAARPFKKIQQPQGGTRDETGSEALFDYFGSATTNEFPYALTSADGTGRVAFEVQNAGLNSYMGCGARYTDRTGAVRPRPCSLVIVPRGHFNPYPTTPTDESLAGAVNGSPFRPALWQHRIVIPLEFAPVEGYCPLDQAERRTAGAEVIAEAMTAWQPALCTDGGPKFGYSAVGDTEAGRQILLDDPSAPGLVFTADPVSAPPGDPPRIHAPAALGSIVLAVNIDATIMDEHQGTVPPEIRQLTGTALSDIKLSPRLVAKLLTQSYQRDAKTPACNPAQPANPCLAGTVVNSIRFDKEFLDLNPVFRYWDRLPGFTLDGLMVAAGNSAADVQVWRWLLGDPDARAFLEGHPDDQGMVVNPAYAFVPGSPPDFFPKADPVCTSAIADGVEYKNCTLDYRPYMDSMGVAAQQTLRADMKGKTPPLITVGAVKDANGRYPWTTIERKAPGFRFAMSVTDAGSAARYGLFTATLCKSTKDATGTYLPSDCRAPTADAISAAAVSAVPSAIGGVKVIDPVKAWSTPGAYPLATLTYAVANPTQPADARHDYATLLRHIAGQGQQLGLARGDLPPGYVPLPTEMRTQTMIAADTLEHWTSPSPSPVPESNGDDGGGSGPAADATTGPPATALPTGVPTAGAAPSPGAVVPSVQPSAERASQRTPGTGPLGWIRFLLIGALIAALVGGVAGPILQRIGSGSRGPEGRT